MAEAFEAEKIPNPTRICRCRQIPLNTGLYLHIAVQYKEQQKNTTIYPWSRETSRPPTAPHGDQLTTEGILRGSSSDILLHRVQISDTPRACYAAAPACRVSLPRGGGGGEQTLECGCIMGVL
jgi:hypothetical protein